MAEDGYEVMGPGAGPAPPAPLPAAFPDAAPSPADAPKAIPDFPKAGTNGPPPPPAAAAPPPPPPHVGTAKNKKSEGHETKKKKSKANMAESQMDTVEGGEGNAVFQRPNGCDTCQLASVIFATILIIAIATPILLAAMGKGRN
uniref:Uncharacterized protein n=1 Tax=Caenorhabditis japonica TaxID=281687 RepID=A0A8R1IIQ1_CAEJA